VTSFGIMASVLRRNPIAAAFTDPVVMPSDSLLLENGSILVSESGDYIGSEPTILDPYWNFVTLSIPMTGTAGSSTFIDLKNHHIDNHGVVISAGGDSGIFGGASSIEVTSNPDFDLGTGDFTIEAYVTPSELRNGVITCRQNPDVSQVFQLAMAANGTYNCQLRNAAGGMYRIAAGGTVTVGKRTLSLLIYSILLRYHSCLIGYRRPASYQKS